MEIGISFLWENAPKISRTLSLVNQKIIASNVSHGRKKLTKKKDESEQNWWKLFWNKKLLPKGGTSWSPLLRNDSTHSCWVQGKVEIPLTRKMASVQSNGAGEPSNSPAMWGSFRGRYESLSFRGEDTHKISPACTVICSIHIACVPSLMNKGERTDEYRGRKQF